MNDENLLSEELDFISREARENVIDSIHSTLFSKAGQLDGNTESLDVEWFAREIYQELDLSWGSWDTLEPQERGHWIEVATAALNRFPYLLNRIAGRCKVQAEAVRSLLEWARKTDDE